MKLFIFFCVVVFFVSCTPRPDYPPEIREALSEAGDNSIQLKKVLEYYGKNQEDSLKLKAAQFCWISYSLLY